MSYLDKTGLQHFWSKINSKMATKEQLQAVARSSTYTCTIPVTGWSSTAPFYVDIVVEGLSETDSPFITPVYTGTLETDQAIQEAWNKINSAITSENNLRVYAFEEVPTTEIPIRLQVITDTGVNGGGNYMVTLTQAEYDALVEAGTINENTYYFIKEG